MEETPSSESQADGGGVVPCGSCGSTAPPDEQGLCPGVPGNKCRRTRVGSKLAAVHEGRSKLTPSDLEARDALVARLFAERGGRETLDIVSQLRIEDYATAQIQLAKVTRRLEAVGAVTVAGNIRASVVNTYNLFSARVEKLAAELPPVRASAAATSDRLEDLTLDQLRGRVEKMLSLIDEASDRERHRERVAAEDKTQTAAVTPVRETPPPAPEPPPAPPCDYCNQSPCIGDQHPAFATLHAKDPIEVSRREAEARERELDEADAREFLATGIVTPHMRARQAARERKPTPEEIRQAEVRRELGWNEGVLNEQSGYRRRE